MITLRRLSLCLLVTGCTAENPDYQAPQRVQVAPPIGVDSDSVQPIDGGAALDLVSAVDLASGADLVQLPDLAPRADLSPALDLARAPDLEPAACSQPGMPCCASRCHSADGSALTCDTSTNTCIRCGVAGSADDACCGDTCSVGTCMVNNDQDRRCVTCGTQNPSCTGVGGVGQSCLSTGTGYFCRGALQCYGPDQAWHYSCQ